MYKSGGRIGQGVRFLSLRKEKMTYKTDKMHVATSNFVVARDLSKRRCKQTKKQKKNKRHE
jgi:hypothetical protein